MPYPNEHAVRLQEPGKFKRFRSTYGGTLFNRIKVPKTVRVIWGITADGHAEPQALRFPTKYWTENQVRTWLKDHNIKAHIEPAVGEMISRARALLLSEGGAGSGHFGHAGRPGERGGSAPKDGGSSGDRSDVSQSKPGAAAAALAMKKVPGWAKSGVKVVFGKTMTEGEAEYVFGKVVLNKDLEKARIFNDWKAAEEAHKLSPKDHIIYSTKADEMITDKKGDVTKEYIASLVHHEVGHHVWKTVLSDKQRAMATKMFAKVMTPRIAAYAYYFKQAEIEREIGPARGLVANKMAREKFAEAFRLHVAKGAYSKEFARLMRKAK